MPDGALSRFFVVPMARACTMCIFAGAWAIPHIVFTRRLQLGLYQRAICRLSGVRGTGFVAPVIVAYLIFRRRAFTVRTVFGGWAGARRGIFGPWRFTTLCTFVSERETAECGLGACCLTGLLSRLSNDTLTPYGIRATGDPFTFLACFS